MHPYPCGRKSERAVPASRDRAHRRCAPNYGLVDPPCRPTYPDAMITVWRARECFMNGSDSDVSACIADLFGPAPRISNGRAPVLARGADTAHCTDHRMKEDGMLTFYFAPGSSSMAPHIALHEVGVPFESRPISFATRENRTPAYRALNAEGKVPLLLIDGRPLTEVAAILFYLARRFPDSGLWPDGDVEAEAHVVAWMSFLASTIHPARRQGVEHAAQIWTIAETRLGAREWAVGRYSIADIHLFRLFWRFRN